MRAILALTLSLAIGLAGCAANEEAGAPTPGGGTPAASPAVTPSPASATPAVTPSPFVTPIASPAPTAAPAGDGPEGATGDGDGDGAADEPVATPSAPAQTTPPPATPTSQPADAEPTPATPTPPPASPAPTSPPPPTERPAEIRNFQFSPDPITVAAGTTIRWTNIDAAPHSATGDDAAFDTGVLDEGESGTATFPTAGTFGYFCKVHPSMRGTVTVTAAA